MIGSENLGTFVTELQNYLGTVFQEMTVYSGFQKSPDYREWKTPALSISLTSVKTAPISFDDYLGAAENGLSYGERFGIQGELTLAFTLFFPVKETEQYANTFFLNLVNELLFWENADFYEFNCKPVAFSEHSQCFMLEAEGKTKQILLKTEESVLLKGVQITAIPEKGGD